MSENFSNVLGGVLATDITAIATSFDLVAGGGNGLPTTNFRLTLSDGTTGTGGKLTTTEVIFVATRSGDNLSGVTRGYESTIGGGAARAWTAGTKAYHLVTAGMLQGFSDDYATKAGIQQNAYRVATAGGTADALTATFTPDITALTNGTSVLVQAASENATTTPTFSPNGLDAKTIVKGNGQVLAVGDISGANHWLELVYDSSLDKWILRNPLLLKSYYSTLKHKTYYSIASATYADITNATVSITVTNAPVTFDFMAAVQTYLFPGNPSYPVYLRALLNGGEYTDHEVDAKLVEGIGAASEGLITTLSAPGVLTQNTTYTIKLQGRNSVTAPAQASKINASNNYPSAADPDANSTMTIRVY